MMPFDGGDNSLFVDWLPVGDILFVLVEWCNCARKWPAISRWLPSVLWLFWWWCAFIWYVHLQFPFLFMMTTDWKWYSTFWYLYSFIRYLHLWSDWFHFCCSIHYSGRWWRYSRCVDVLSILRILLTWKFCDYIDITIRWWNCWAFGDLFHDDSRPVTFILLMMTFCHSSYSILLFYGIRTHCCAFIACIRWLFILLLLSLTILLLFITSILLSVSDTLFLLMEIVCCVMTFCWWWTSGLLIQFLIPTVFPFYLLLLLMWPVDLIPFAGVYIHSDGGHWLLSRYWCAVILPVF
jgi:hypothetical protein